MYSCGPLHMDEQRQDGQLEPTYCSSVPIRDVALKTCRKQWTIRSGGERGSGISVLIAQHDHDINNKSKFRLDVVQVQRWTRVGWKIHKSKISYKAPYICCWLIESKALYLGQLMNLSADPRIYLIVTIRGRLSSLSIEECPSAENI